MIQAGANVDDERWAQCPDPISNAAMVDAPQRELAILRRSAQDAVRAALLGALVVGIADKQLHLLADVLIDLRRDIPEGVEREIGREDIVAPPRIASRRRRGVGPQKVLRELLRDRVDAIRRNHVARKGVAHPLPVHQTAGRRIVNRDQAARRIAQVAEVAAQLRLVWHRKGGRVRRRLLVALVIEHEERLVPAIEQPRNRHRAVDLESILIELVIRLLALVHLEEVLVRVELLAPRELVRGAVQRVCA